MSYILFDQEVVTRLYIVTYYIKWVTTSWTDGHRPVYDGHVEEVPVLLRYSVHLLLPAAHLCSPAGYYVYPNENLTSQLLFAIYSSVCVVFLS